MIALGLHDRAKGKRVSAYCAGNSIRKVFVFSPAKFRLSIPSGIDVEYIEWDEIIQYKFYYRILQEVGKDTLLVVNECLRLQNRYDLTYNCLRLFLNQTPHVLVFQCFPLIDRVDDFMILFDFDTRSRWKREGVRAGLLKECQVECSPIDVSLRAIPVATDGATQDAYRKEKRKLIDGLGLKDPNTIPRNLHLLSGKAKLAHVDPGAHYVGRNNRFGLDNMRTYRDAGYPGACTVFEFCHNFLDFSDFLSLSRQSEVPALVSDLKVDQWYLGRCQEWIGRLHEAYSVLRQ